MERTKPNDSELMASAESEINKQSIEYAARNHLYTELLNDYLKERKSKDERKKWFKVIFFSVVMAAFCGTVFMSLYATISIMQRSNLGFADVGVAASALAGLLSAFIVLPKIIVEHLVPMNEESNLIDIVKSMQENDAEIRSAIRKRDKDRSVPEETGTESYD